ncbi:MAG: CHASE2 domain-containing protein [Thiohalocapsa sp.]
MAWPRGLREAALSLAVALAVLFGLGQHNSTLTRGLETTSLDLRFRLRGPLPQRPDVTVIMVDDASLAKLGRWPLPRRLFATALRKLDAAGAAVVAFDLLFAEPEKPVPAAVRDAAKRAADALAEAPDQRLHGTLAQIAADNPDADLAAALKANGKVLLPLAFSRFGGTPQEAPPVLADQVYQKLLESPTEPLFPLQPSAALLPIPELAAASAGLGHVAIAFDRDGEPRYDYLALPFAGDFVPSLPVRIVAAYRGVPWSDVGLALGDSVEIGDIRMPTDPAMRLVVNYRGPLWQGTASFQDLLTDKIPPQRLKGRIVLIGASFTGNADAYPGPFGQTPIPGTERLANIVDTILSRDFIRESPPPWPSIVAGLVAALAVAIGVASAWLPTRLAALAGLLPVAGWLGGAQLAFQHGLWLPLVNPVAALVAATASVLLFRYGFVDRQRRLIQGAFRHYLAPDLVNQLAAHPERLQLGGETRMLSIMFSDIRGFTSISESFKSNPQGLSRLINRGFLTPMTKLIMARRGTIDKYMGDCIMAFWNAPVDDPGHADDACGSALAMLAEIDRINAGLEVEAQTEGRPFLPIHIGIGVNTGECVVGNMGSDERFAYTAMGDAVNLASRLEGQSKTYGLSLIVGETTCAAAPSWAALELDLIAVKGKEEAVRIFTLLGDAEHAQSAEFRALAEPHDAMLRAYRARNWAAARTALAQCRGRDVRMAGFYDLYEERLAYFEANPPEPDWDGVFVALTK